MSTGILGDGEMQPGKYNMALARRAIRENWPITDQIRQLIVNQMAIVAGKSKDERNRISASKVLVAADSVNVRREAIDTPKQHEHHVSGGLVVADIRAELLNDPKYLDFLRNHQGDGDTGSLCGDGGQALEVRETPESPRPSTNGHHHGNGRH